MLHAFDAGNGILRRSAGNPAPPIADPDEDALFGSEQLAIAPVIVDGRPFLGSGDDHVYVYGLTG